jgi:hypothetical protein
MNLHRCRVSVFGDSPAITRHAAETGPAAHDASHDKSPPKGGQG